MNKDDVMRWAQEADAYADAMDIGGKNYIGLRDEHFATLVAAAEREACAKLENEMALSPAHFPTMAEWRAYREGVEEYTAAIRARGNS